MQHPPLPQPLPTLDSLPPDHPFRAVIGAFGEDLALHVLNELNFVQREKIRSQPGDALEQALWSFMSKYRTALAERLEKLRNDENLLRFVSSLVNPSDRTTTGATLGAVSDGARVTVRKSDELREPREG